MKTLLVTGSSGLIGSEACYHFSKLGWEIIGIDNNQREKFFGPSGSTHLSTLRLKKNIKDFGHYSTDIRDRAQIDELIKNIRPDALIHTAAQPSHDLAASIPFDDFDINAGGTLNLLEACRKHCPEAPFVHMSTNKVYGDGPNRLSIKELNTRYDFLNLNTKGINEDFPIDQSTHSLFGASKLAADIMVQEYGRYFGMPTCCLRGGCLTGPNHASVELHGFLSYLIKCSKEKKVYNIFGYKGKQVRDNIHSADVVRFMEEFIGAPRSGEVYNIGGGKANSCSILEAISLIESVTGWAQKTVYTEGARLGDHICYYTDLSKTRAHYPNWDITYNLMDIIKEIV